MELATDAVNGWIADAVNGFVPDFTDDDTDGRRCTHHPFNPLSIR
jgi:hypothetical protein